MLIRLEDCQPDTFSPYVGTGFLFRDPTPAEGIVRLTLHEVRRHASAEGEQRGVSSTVRRGGFFSLLFVAETGTRLTSGLCRLDHPDFEPFSLLLSRVFLPGRRPDDLPLFEAVFG